MWFLALRRALFVLLIAAGVIAGILILAQDQTTIRIKSDIAAEDPRSPAYVAALSGATLTRGNHYDVLTNGDQIFPPMLEAIESAQNRINFETYIYDAGEIADRFTNALERAARRGVKVTVLVDAIGGSPMEGDHETRLESAGAHVLTFNSPWYMPESVNYRTHRKILVVDGDIGFTGGVGVADHWMGNADSKHHWRDTQVRIRGPIVRLLEATFYENALESHGPIVPEFEDRPETAPSADEAASIIVRSSSSGGSTDLKRLYLQAIASARRTIDLTSPYFVTDESTLWSIEDARRRGVRIRLLVEGDITDAREVRIATGVRSAAQSRGRDLRIPANDDACEDGRGGWDSEYFRIGELRQSISGVERRAERRRLEPEAGRTVHRRSGEGSAVQPTPRARQLAPAVAAHESARAYVELFW